MQGRKQHQRRLVAAVHGCIENGMADVFVSYKREDRGRVQPLVDALVAEGVSVWWDVGLEGGAAWRHSLQAALEAARCVIVVWSALSVGPDGEFVQDEASWAKARGVYLPIIIDAVSPPLGFGQVHTLRLTAWKGDRRDPAFAGLLAAVRAMVGGAQRSSAAQVTPSAPADLRPQRRKPQVAVLAFRCQAADPDQLSFAEGIAEDVIIGLSRSSLLRVTPGQLSLAYEAQALATRRVRDDLDADYIVQGQVRAMGKTLRVSAHLAGGRDDKALWSARYDRPIEDLFAVQDEIALAIISTLEPALIANEEEQAFEADESSLSAWELFLRGRWHFWRGRPHDNERSRAYLERALALDPGDPPTLCLLSFCCLSDVWAGLSRDPRAAVAEAHRYALKAVGLDGSDAYARYALGVVLSMMGRSAQAEAEQRHALELNPYLAVAAGELSRLHAFAGRTEEAIREADRAIAASPNDPHAWLWRRAKAIACFVDGRYAEAVAHAAEACARRPDYFFLHYLLAACASAAGEVEQAAAALAEGRRRMPVYSAAAIALGHPFTERRNLERYLDALRAAGWADPAPEDVSAGKRA